MRKLEWVFDASSIFIIKKVKESGLKFWRIGYGF